MHEALALCCVLWTTEAAQEIRWLPHWTICAENYTAATERLGALKRRAALAPQYQQTALAAAMKDARWRLDFWTRAYKAHLEFWVHNEDEFGGYPARPVIAFDYLVEARQQIGDAAWLRQEWPPPIPAR